MQTLVYIVFLDLYIRFKIIVHIVLTFEYMEWKSLREKWKSHHFFQCVKYLRSK